MSDPWHRTIAQRLPEPWDAFTISVVAEPTLASWQRLTDAYGALKQSPDLATLGAAVAALVPFVAAHDITDAAGEPLALEAGAMTGTLIACICTAILAALGGASADPFGRPASPAPSPERSSPPSRRRSTSPSSA